MTAHRSKKGRPLSSVPAGQPPGMRMKRNCRLPRSFRSHRGWQSSLVSHCWTQEHVRLQVTSSQLLSAIAGLEHVLASKPQDVEGASRTTFHQPLLDPGRCQIPGDQQSTLVSHCWTRECAGLQAADATRENNHPSSAVAGLRRIAWIHAPDAEGVSQITFRQPMLDLGA
jgi:hypothetical protein